MQFFSQWVGYLLSLKRYSTQLLVLYICGFILPNPIDTQVWLLYTHKQPQWPTKTLSMSLGDLQETVSEVSYTDDN